MQEWQGSGAVTNLLSTDRHVRMSDPQALRLPEMPTREKHREA